MPGDALHEGLTQAKVLPFPTPLGDREVKAVRDQHLCVDRGNQLVCRDSAAASQFMTGDRKAIATQVDVGICVRTRYAISIAAAGVVRACHRDRTAGGDVEPST